MLHPFQCHEKDSEIQHVNQPLYRIITTFKNVHFDMFLVFNVNMLNNVHVVRVHTTVHTWRVEYERRYFSMEFDEQKADVMKKW